LENCLIAGDQASEPIDVGSPATSSADSQRAFSWLTSSRFTIVKITGIGRGDTSAAWLSAIGTLAAVVVALRCEDCGAITITLDSDHLADGTQTSDPWPLRQQLMLTLDGCDHLARRRTRRRLRVYGLDHARLAALQPDWQEPDRHRRAAARRER
jgi:hypothetical protein